MRLSRLVIAIAAAFSTSAFAVAPPGFGPQPDEGAHGSQPSTNTEKRDSASQQGANSSEREGNAWLSSTPSDAWQASAQSESQNAKDPERTAMRNGVPPLQTDPTVAPQLVPERTPSIGEQS